MARSDQKRQEGISVALTPHRSGAWNEGIAVLWKEPALDVKRAWLGKMSNHEDIDIFILLTVEFETDEDFDMVIRTLAEVGPHGEDLLTKMQRRFVFLSFIRACQFDQFSLTIPIAAKLSG